MNKKAFMYVLAFAAGVVLSGAVRQVPVIGPKIPSI